jgi:hypothetical protein
MRHDMIAPDYPIVPMGSDAACPACATQDHALADTAPGMIPMDTSTIVLGAALAYLIYYVFTKS